MCRLRRLDPFSLYPTSLFIFVDYILYIQLNINLITKYTKKIKKNMYRWPKQRIWRRLGLFSLSCLRSLSLSRFSQFTTYVYNKTLVSINKYEEIKKKRNLHMAETTCLLLFGPVLRVIVIAFLLSSRCIFCSLQSIHSITKYQLV